MSHELQKSIIHILNSKNGSAGTGFLLSNHLAVSCAHVIQAAGSDRDQTASFRFFVDEEKAREKQRNAASSPGSADEDDLLKRVPIYKAKVLDAGWSPSSADDIAFLHLEYVPKDIETVVLGSAKSCQGHDYSTYGFARLAGYADRWSHGTLEGVVPHYQKQSMLQYEGNGIRGGMSGAPILDRQTGHVVGMVSEFKDDQYSRFAWATTSDTILHFASSLTADHPSLRMWPEEYGPKELQLYLQHLITTNEILLLPDKRSVLLERIYVSLRADEMNVAERIAENERYREKINELHNELDLEKVANITKLKKLSSGTQDDQYTEFDAVHKTIVRQPIMLLLEARNWQRLFGKREQHLVSLAEVEKRHRYVVILGDPGSGKTTLGKWLILQFANALKENKTFVQVRADLVQPGAEADKRIDLGPSRLPIFIRIANYARTRWKAGNDGKLYDSKLSLERFISSNQEYEDLPTGLTSETVDAMARDYLAQGRALVVLDGLDEVTNPNQRNLVMQTVRKFIEEDKCSTTPMNNAWGGNRLLLTSRIVGYQFDPLIDLPHYTVEDMDEKAISAFCQAWMAYVADVSEAEEEGQKLKKAIFKHAHRGVRVLAGNPLLLTILAQVYWTSKNRSLPARRVSLFDKAFEAFYNQRRESWENVGVDEELLTNALGAVAAYIHENEETGFTEKGTVRESLEKVLDQKQVKEVLEAARDVSGFLVERGEGVYGFLHRSVQEYFAAKYLTYSRDQMYTNLSTHLLDPIWREPIVMAVGMISQPSFPGSLRHLPKVFDALLSTHDAAGDFLPRRELLAVAACLECERDRVPKEVSQKIAQRLLALYARSGRNLRSPVLRKRIQDAFRTLQENEIRPQVEKALCDAVLNPSFELRYAAIEIIIETQWDSPEVAKSLVNAWSAFADPVVSLLTALDEMAKRKSTYFQTDFLPLRQEVTSKSGFRLWEKASISQPWKAMFRILYLPPGSYFKFDRINRDSPLTPYLLQMLKLQMKQNSLDTSVVAEIRHYLVPLASNPGTALARDAALALSAIGDVSWIPQCIKNAGDQKNLLNSIAGYLVLARALEQDLDDSLPSSGELEKTLEHSLEYTRDFKHASEELALSKHSLREIVENMRRIQPHAFEGIRRASASVDNVLSNPHYAQTRTHDLALTLKKELESFYRHMYTSISNIGDNSLFQLEMNLFNEICTSLEQMRNWIDIVNYLDYKIPAPSIPKNFNPFSYGTQVRKEAWEKYRKQNSRVNALAFALDVSLPLDIQWALALTDHYRTKCLSDKEFAIGSEFISLLNYASSLMQSRREELRIASISVNPAIYGQALQKADTYRDELSTVSLKARALASTQGLFLPFDTQRALKYARRQEKNKSIAHENNVQEVHDSRLEIVRISAILHGLLDDLEIASAQEYLPSEPTHLSHTYISHLKRDLADAQKYVQLYSDAREQRKVRSSLLARVDKRHADLTRELETAETYALKLSQEFERALRIGNERSKEIDLVSVRHLDFTFDFDVIYNFARPSANTNEIIRAISERKDKRDGQLLASLHKVQKALATVTPIAQVISSFIEAYMSRWSGEKEPSLLPPTVVKLDSNGVMSLVQDLLSLNDIRRESAKEILAVRHVASKVGLLEIEQIAEYIERHADNPQIVTQLIWAMEKVLHDEPIWIKQWISQITGSVPSQKARIIIESVQRITPKAYDALVNTLPHAEAEVNISLLKSLNWLVRLKNVPRGKLPSLRKRLFTWLVNEGDPEIRKRIIEILGYWPEDSNRVGQMFLDWIDHPKRKMDLPVVCKALACLTMRHPDLVKEVRKKLQPMQADRDIAAALVRISVIRSKEAVNGGKRNYLDMTLQALSKASSDPSHCLEALLKAGIDDDVWEDTYHGVLVSALRECLEHQINKSPDQKILTDLVERFEQSLQKRDWPSRRFHLSVIAACTEVMPVAVQRAYKGDLEALLTQAARDAESFNSRRFALTTIGYLRTVTETVAPALLAGCHDTEEVQRDTVIAASHFQTVKGNLLPIFLEEMNGESVSRAYMITHLLSALGRSAAFETAELRDQIITAVVKLLKDNASQREVFISGEYKGKLEDALYTTLLQIAGWMEIEGIEEGVQNGNLR